MDGQIDTVSGNGRADRQTVGMDGQIDRQWEMDGQIDTVCGKERTDRQSVGNGRADRHSQWEWTGR